jgi:predicted PurR-regulated permease PerM
MSIPTVSDRVIRSEIAAWLIAAVLLVLVLRLHLLSALFAGLLVYELVHILVPGLHLGRVAGKRAKLMAVALLAAVIVALLTLVVFWGVAFFKGSAENLPLLVKMMADILEGSRVWLPQELERYLPADIEQMKLGVADWLRQHAADLRVAGQETLRTVAHMLIGMVIGAMISLHDARRSPGEGQPLAGALAERVQRFGGAFRRVVFAQVRISLLNTTLTWLYLGVALPLLGLSLPYTKTLILVTFIAGLLPVIGNLVSNTVIIVVSMSQSLGLAVASLAFLVIIHKLEYFLNAHIIGSRIKARAWELLLAMLLMEAAFGLRGLVAAPVFYAYLKDELSARGLV